MVNRKHLMENKNSEDKIKNIIFQLNTKKNFKKGGGKLDCYKTI